LAVLLAVAAVYIVIAFTAPNALLRIVLRCLPLLPVAVWTIWFDRARPLEHQPAVIRAGGRFALLLIVMGFAVVLLGLALNWLYDPSRIV
jgi:hypothetical protein